ncbi:hypothetical protein NQ317_014107 [Molorchus minor]|uniref:Uncharacterized protein n=1 Tax=Molorchus minor TaxID=1323400 RepID=A0ABQ9IU93_9CUCU|nr:hypothetical protein NQ317_014107 [Molorchus minor]
MSILFSAESGTTKMVSTVVTGEFVPEELALATLTLLPISFLLLSSFSSGLFAPFPLTDRLTVISVVPSPPLQISRLHAGDESLLHVTVLVLSPLLLTDLREFFLFASEEFSLSSNPFLESTSCPVSITGFSDRLLLSSFAAESELNFASPSLSLKLLKEKRMLENHTMTHVRITLPLKPVPLRKPLAFLKPKRSISQASWELKLVTNPIQLLSVPYKYTLKDFVFVSFEFEETESLPFLSRIDKLQNYAYNLYLILFVGFVDPLLHLFVILLIRFLISSNTAVINLISHPLYLCQGLPVDFVKMSVDTPYVCKRIFTIRADVYQTGGVVFILDVIANMMINGVQQLVIKPFGNEKGHNKKNVSPSNFGYIFFNQHVLNTCNWTVLQLTRPDNSNLRHTSTYAVKDVGKNKSWVKSIFYKIPFLNISKIKVKSSAYLLYEEIADTINHIEFIEKI